MKKNNKIKKFNKTKNNKIKKFNKTKNKKFNKTKNNKIKKFNKTKKFNSQKDKIRGGGPGMFRRMVQRSTTAIKAASILRKMPLISSAKLFLTGYLGHLDTIIPSILSSFKKTDSLNKILIQAGFEPDMATNFSRTIIQPILPILNKDQIKSILSLFIFSQYKNDTLNYRYKYQAYGETPTNTLINAFLSNQHKETIETTCLGDLLFDMKMNGLKNIDNDLAKGLQKILIAMIILKPLIFPQDKYKEILNILGFKIINDVAAHLVPPTAVPAVGGVVEVSVEEVSVDEEEKKALAGHFEDDEKWPEDQDAAEREEEQAEAFRKMASAEAAAATVRRAAAAAHVNITPFKFKWFYNIPLSQITIILDLIYKIVNNLLGDPTKIDNSALKLSEYFEKSENLCTELKTIYNNCSLLDELGELGPVNLLTKEGCKQLLNSLKESINLLKTGLEKTTTTIKQLTPEEINENNEDLYETIVSIGDKIIEELIKETDLKSHLITKILDQTNSWDTNLAKQIFGAAKDGKIHNKFIQTIVINENILSKLLSNFNILLGKNNLDPQDYNKLYETKCPT